MTPQERRYYLDAMGIQAWELRGGPAPVVEAATESVAEPIEEPVVVAAAVPPPVRPAAQVAPRVVAPPPPADSHAAAPAPRADLGPGWEGPPPEWDEIPFPDDEEPFRPSPEGAEGVVDSRFVRPSPEAAPLGWEALAERVAACTACPELVKNRSRTVFGVGNRNAQLLVIGEAPGRDEDLQGEPFVGRAGQLLNAMLLAMGFKRDEVYIANILKCRPPNNRDPQPAEAAHCAPFLQRQIELIGPKAVLAVGRIAAQNLLHTDTAIGALRGRVHRLGAAGLPLVVTYHPAYLLRSPAQKGRAWEDLKLALKVLRG